MSFSEETTASSEKASLECLENFSSLSVRAHRFLQSLVWRHEKTTARKLLFELLYTLFLLQTGLIDTIHPVLLDPLKFLVSSFPADVLEEGFTEDKAADDQEFSSKRLGQLLAFDERSGDIDQQLVSVDRLQLPGGKIIQSVGGLTQAGGDNKVDKGLCQSELFLANQWEDRRGIGIFSLDDGV